MKVIEVQKSIVFKGKKYFHNKDGYYRSVRPTKSLHVAIVEDHLGVSVKKGQCVHHIDENKYNNDPSNLTVLSRSYHQKMHMDERPIISNNCMYCGSKFNSKSKIKKWCSKKCENKVNTEKYKSTPHNLVSRACQYCGITFIRTKHQKQKTCSMSCAGFLRNRGKNG